MKETELATYIRELVEANVEFSFYIETPEYYEHTYMIERGDRVTIDRWDTRVEVSFYMDGTRHED